MKKTNRIAVAGLGMLLAFSLACSSNKTAEQSAVESKNDGKGTAPPAAAAKQAEKALVRFVNATTETKDLAFGDMAAFTGIDSHDITAYKELPAERKEFHLLGGEDKSKPLATNSEGLSAGKHYTLLAYTEKDGKVDLDPVVDDLTPPATGQVKVRVINLAPTMKNLDLYATGQKSAVISGAGLDKPTDYKEIDPANASLMVRNSMSRKNSAPVKDLKFTAGKLYTILVFQEKSGKLKVKTIEDQLTAAPNGANS